MTWPACSPLGARRFCVGALYLRLALLLTAAVWLTAAPARAAVEKLAGPPPWRVGGRVGFTLDAAALPDSTGELLEVYLRIPPATIEQLTRDADGDASLRAEVHVRGRFGARATQATHDFTLAASDTARGQGKVLVMRFPAAPGACSIEARLVDMFSKRRGLFYTGREVNEAGGVGGDIEIPRSQLGRDLSDLEFLWPTDGPAPGLSFIRSGRAVVPNPDRLYGLFASELRAGFVARGKAGDERPWHWVARVFDAKGQGVAQLDSTAVTGRLLDADVSFDLSHEPAGLYELAVKTWQEGDAGAIERRAHFSVGWRPDTWLRNAADIADETHFLLEADDEEAFARMHPGQQERYLEDFWARRDPTPETAFNEAYETFRKRVAHANEVFTRGGFEKGMFSEMGRVYIRYGEPSEILHQVVPAGDETLEQQLQDIIVNEDRVVGSVNMKGPGGDMRPFEVWVYEGNIPMPLEVDPHDTSRGHLKRRMLFLFVDEQGTGIYRLRYSSE